MLVGSRQITEVRGNVCFRKVKWAGTLSSSLAGGRLEINVFKSLSVDTSWLQPELRHRGCDSDCECLLLNAVNNVCDHKMLYSTFQNHIQ